MLASTHTQRSLHYKLCRPVDLAQSMQADMLHLMQETYENVERLRFLQDLQQKDFVGLLLEDGGQIRGFTTYALNPGASGRADYDVLFSGDTIIHPGYRGTQELVRGFGHTIGSLLRKSQANRKKLYWFLITKGHRTYLYLPIFFQSYFPGCIPERTADLQKLRDSIAHDIFKNIYYPAEGLIKHQGMAAHLRQQENATASLREKRNKHVAFFLQSNPHYLRGDELACLTEIHIDNMLRTGQRYVQEGLDQPLC